MDYKKIFKSRRSRELVLNLLRFVPDKIMLKIQYRIKLNRKLDLVNPKRFTEKLQWYKINYKNPTMHKCVDKYLVRDYIKLKGLDNILLKLYGKYNDVNDVNLNDLPDKFVIKTTNGAGGLNVVLCGNKAQFDFAKVKKQLVTTEIKSRTAGREWAYYGLKPGIVVEELLENEKNPKAGVNDYKILCYFGKPKYIIVDVDRYVGHKRNFYDINWNNLNVTSDCPGAAIDIPKPDNFEMMLRIAEKLSEDFPFVRVDLYNCNGKIYFGELTFYPWSGYVQFTPDKYDYIFGEDFILPNTNMEYEK